MNFIRVFLWGLAAAMTLQGFLHADEYGSAISFFGGVSLTLSIWSESLWSQFRAWMPGVSTGIKEEGLPRAFVIAALQESARHPGLHTLPTLRRALAEHRRAWDEFREVEVQWMLTHADLIGALRSEGRDVWYHVWDEYDAAQKAHTKLTDLQCWIPRNTQCEALKLSLSEADEYLRAVTAKQTAWERLLSMDASLTLAEWWNATAAPTQLPLLGLTTKFVSELATLHNVTTPKDARVRRLETNTSVIATVLGAGCRWRGPVVRSLLLRDLWSSCLQHIHRRESRVHEMMVATGVQDLYNTHERLLAAALRSVGPAERTVVQNWFDMAANYAWWLSEDIPTIVRRCVGQSVGDCRRIGVTEITSLMAQFDERARIIKDWTRCLFIGMWNAMPAIALLFIVETVILLIPRRHVHTFVMADGQAAAPKFLMENGEPQRAVPLLK
jgi:hypothetical protein